jgi:hypothetical protein
VQNIPTFLKSFSGEVDVSEALEPLESFKCFNEVGTLMVFATRHTCAWSLNGTVAKKILPRQYYSQYYFVHNIKASKLMAIQNSS